MKRYKVICPLINFRIQNILIGPTELTDEEVRSLFKEREKKLVEGIELYDGIKIRRISKEDLEELEPTLHALPTYARFSPKVFVLEKYVKTEANHRFHVDGLMRNIVLALRLLKKGYVFGGFVFYILVSEKRPYSWQEWSWDEVQPLGPWGFKYTLNFEEIPTLKKIIKTLQSTDFSKRKGLRLACSRFQRAYEEGDPEDQLVDLMIAFEALFLKGEKATSQRGQTIAIACSTLLGKNEEEREEIRSFLTKAYAIRNCIVHGAEYKKPYVKEEFEMEDFVSTIENYLRASIKKLLA